MFSVFVKLALVVSAAALTHRHLEPAKAVEVEAESMIDFHAVADPTGAVTIPKAYQASVTKAETDTINFWNAFFNSLGMIFATEIGDKTFFIAAIMSMRHNPWHVYAGAISALAIMTVLSAAAGFILPNMMPRQYTHWFATGLFVYFGLLMLKDAYEMFQKGEGEGASDELEETEEELAKKQTKDANKRYFKVVMQALTLTFLAEWGDRSQIATIALAAAKDPFGVTIGAILGHSVCTGGACIGGKVLASSISERVVVLIGGVLFLLFAAHSAFFEEI